jgi:hypothetical protein
VTLRIEDDVARLEGACGVAEAEALFAAFASGRVSAADVSECVDMHAAVVQVLLRFGVALHGRSCDPFLRDLVTPAVENARNRRKDRNAGSRSETRLK